MWKRRLWAAAIGAILPLFFSFPAKGAEAKAYAVLDLITGEFSAEKRSDDVLPGASTAKIMTALVAAEEGELSKRIPILPEDAAEEGSRAYLQPGEEPTLEELLEALLLASGNDAASAVARGVGGSREEFIKMMNRKAEELGLENTRYENPLGLDGERQFTTARDLARLAAAALENETVARLLGTKYASFGGHVLKNHHKLLFEETGCVAGKTGFTKKAGRCLVSVFERKGRRAVVVTLADPDDWRDHRALADGFFREVEEVKLAFSFPIRTLDFQKEEGELLGEASLPLRPGEREKLSFTAEADHFLWRLPCEGEEAGLFRITLAGRTVSQGRLFFHALPPRAFLRGKKG